jgi:hypothetical protein
MLFQKSQSTFLGWPVEPVEPVSRLKYKQSYILLFSGQRANGKRAKPMGAYSPMPQKKTKLQKKNVKPFSPHPFPRYDGKLETRCKKVLISYFEGLS